MISVLNRLIPFINRSSRNAQSNEQTQGPALSQRPEESDLSTSWLTLSRNEIDNFGGNTGQTIESNSIVNSDAASTKRKLSNRSQRLLSGAISRFPFVYKGEYIIENDISNGREKYKIPAVSYRRSDRAPMDYHYVTQHIQYNPVPLNVSFSSITGCKCVDDCSNGNCNCSSLVNPATYYNSKGRLSDEYNIDSPEVIYECNACCNCNPKNCKNMVIQSGTKTKVMLFKTKSRGWGVRTLEDLKRGTFIGVYSGELVHARDSYQRQDDTYLFNLAGAHIYYPQEPKTADSAKADDDEEVITDQQLPKAQASGPKSNEDQYVCDAKFYGNFTRFINHSCEPNVIGVKSFTIHQDLRFPYIAFFTNKNVSANSELTLNYGDNYWLVKCKRDKVYCLCKRSKCRFTKKTFSHTLKMYEKQLKEQRQQN